MEIHETALTEQVQDLIGSATSLKYLTNKDTIFVLFSLPTHHLASLSLITNYVTNPKE
jgi:hypothetical protein